MRCEDVLRGLPEYAVGAAGPIARARIARHISGCESCQRELKVFNAVAGLVEALPAVDPPPGLWNGVAVRIAREEAVPVSAPRAVATRLRALAAAGAVIAVATAVLLARGQGDRQVPVGIEAIYARHHMSLAAADPLSDRTALASLELATSWLQEPAQDAAQDGHRR